MVKKVYNSSNKQIGKIEVLPNKIIITDIKSGRLNLEIVDSQIVEWAQAPEYNENILVRLYDEFYLRIGEIAALSNVLYHRANKWVLNLPIKTSKGAGRRNGSYNTIFSKERRKHLSEGQKRYSQYLKTINQKRFIYERTPEIKKKIALGVKKAQLEGRAPSPREIAIAGWRNEKFDHADFKRGIAGFIYSYKNKKDVFFRSLFELYYLLMLEQNNSISEYKYEPFVIRCEDGTSYRPDLQVGMDVIELKSYDYVYKQGGKIQERFEYKKEQGIKYCKKKGLSYKVIFDKDYNFKTDVYKHWLQEHRDIIKKYNIRFNEPKRVGL